MKRGLRIGLGVLLAVAGLLLALFFTSLLFVTDCSNACRTNGERAPAYGLIGVGAGALVCGALLLADRERLAWSLGLVVAGVVGMLGGLVSGGRWGWIGAAAGLAVSALAAWSLRSRD